jgi:hypothetical protein
MGQAVLSQAGHQEVRVKEKEAVGFGRNRRRPPPESVAGIKRGIQYLIMDHGVVRLFPETTPKSFATRFANL